LVLPKQGDVFSLFDGVVGDLTGAAGRGGVVEGGVSIGLNLYPKNKRVQVVIFKYPWWVEWQL
jgi:hypothetical protein